MGQFTEKVWQDSPSTSTPISAAALIDLEDRLSDYTDEENVGFILNTVANDLTDNITAADAGVLLAAAALKPVYLKAGVTRVSTRLILSNGTHSFNGLGRGETTLKHQVVSGNATNPLRLNQVDKISVRSLTLTGNAAARNSGSWGLHVETCSNTFIHDVEIGTGVSAGILAHRTQNHVVSFCHVHDTFADGIHFTNGGTYGTGVYCDFKAIGNHIENTVDDSIAAVGYAIGEPSGADSEVRRVIMLGNTAVHSEAQGLASHGASDVVISSNVVDTTSSHGLRVDGGGSYEASSPTHNILIGNVVVDAGELASSGSYHGVAVSLPPNADNGVIITGNHISNPRNHGIFYDGDSGTISNNRINMGDSASTAIVVGQTAASGNEVPHNTTIQGNFIETCPVGAINVLAPSSDPAYNVSIIGNTINEANSTSAANTDTIYCSDINRLLIANNTIIDSGGRARWDMRLVNCNTVDIGRNILPSGYIITLTNCTDVLMPMIVAAANPSDTTTYRAGQEWLATTSGRYYVFNGTAWKYSVLT